MLMQKIHQPADAVANSYCVIEPIPRVSTPGPEDRVGVVLVSLIVCIHERVIDMFVLVCFVLLVRIAGRC